MIAYRQIKAGRPEVHKRLMLTAIGISALFLMSYLYYHAEVGSVKYPLMNWTRTLYLSILIPHSILAGLMVPFIAAAVTLAFLKRYRAHKAITKWLLPVWLFVSISGVVIYLMLYQYAGAKATR